MATQTDLATEADAYNETRLDAIHGRCITGGDLTRLTRMVQAILGLKVDGKYGPVTQAALARETFPGLEASVQPPKYDADFWTGPLTKPCADNGVPLLYARKWIEVESGGDPCAIGSPGAKGPDGHPQEMGIAQFYNPDDLKKLGLTGAGLRAYCAAPDHPNRPLTDDEVREQAAGAVELIILCQRAAVADAHKVGLSWGTKDMWLLTKLQHGLPGISRSGLPAVTKLLGYPPRSWAEFTTHLAFVKLDPVTERYRSQFAKIVANAELTASVLK